MKKKMWICPRCSYRTEEESTICPRCKAKMHVTENLKIVPLYEAKENKK